MLPGVISVYWTIEALATMLSLVTVHQALDDPRRLEVDEDRHVVGGVGGFEHAHHRHLERVDAGNVEDALG